MKDILTALSGVLAFFITYAMIAGLIAATFCTEYITVAQCPLYVVFGSIFGLTGAFITAYSVHESEL